MTMGRLLTTVEVNVDAPQENVVVVKWKKGRSTKWDVFLMSAEGAREFAALLHKAADKATPPATIELKPAVIAR
jgi:hypothetical protein